LLLFIKKNGSGIVNPVRLSVNSIRFWKTRLVSNLDAKTIKRFALTKN